MLKKLTCCLYALLCFGFNAGAVTTTISGNAPSYAGKKLAIKTYSEQILNEEEDLGEASVSANGDFKFEIEIGQTMQVFIPGEVSKAFLYVEPGMNYVISLPDYRERTIVEKLDPFFAPKDFLASIEGLRRTDFNYQMMEFEDAFDFYSMKHITYGSQPDSLKKSVRDLRRIFSDLQKPFQQRFKEYRYVLLMNMCVGDNQNMQDSVILQLNAIGAEYENPAFWDAFNNVFNDFIVGQLGSEEYELFKRVVVDNNAKMLMEILKQRYKITNQNLRELVAIKTVADLTEVNEFGRGQVISMLQKLGGVIQKPGNRDLLQAVINKTSVNYIGTNATDFEALNSDGKTFKLSDFKGHYVYLNFCNSNLEKTGRDLQVLRRFYDSYDGALAVVNIFLYDDPATVKRMAKPYQGKMVFATVPNSDALRQTYGVKGVPSYLLLDKEGRFLMTKGAEPNDELRLFLQNTLLLNNAKINK
ncbi:MAG: TlpA family protein disulfide reductase [Paludibacteraceae bacterium]|nr:TlpA family protein disulfide reductase [Paludibacteraceae bacterium]